jgi:hypothetical protein
MSQIALEYWQLWLDFSQINKSQSKLSDNPVEAMELNSSL